MVLYKLYVFCSGMKFKMAATAGLSLTLNPRISDRHKKQKLGRGPSNDHSWAVWFQLSKWFQRRSVLKHFYVDVRRNDGQKYPNKSMITNRFGLQKKKIEVQRH
jgi:hypothetical protein